MQNLHRASSFPKLFWLAALAVSLLTNPASSVATAPVEKTNTLSTQGGAHSWYAPNRGFQLKTVNVYLDFLQFYGIQFEYCPSSGTCVSNCYGQSCSSGTGYSVQITQIVTQIKFCYNSGQQIDSLTFTLRDGSLVSTPVFDCNSSSTVPILGNLVGVAVIPKSYSFFGTHYYFDDQGSAWDDVCGFIKDNSFSTTIPDQTLKKCSASNTLLYANEASTKGCTQTLTLTFSKDGISVSQPSWITHNPTSSTFTLSMPIAVDLDAVFTVTMATNILDPLSNTTKTSSLTFTITTVNDCLNTVLTGNITDMSTSINASAVTQALSFDNSSTPTIPSWSTCCGSMTYILSPAWGFLFISGATMSLAATNVADTGAHPTSLIIAMSNYPTISLTKSFTATITCLVQTLTFNTAPAASTTHKYSDSARDLTFVTSQTPACGNTVTFTISPTQTFLSLPSPTSSAGNVRISGASFSNIGTYSETLTSTVNGQTVTANFSVVIEDPCKTAVFQTFPAPLSTMYISIPSVAITTKTFVILTDVQNAYSTIVCPITASLTSLPTQTFISLSGSTISGDPSSLIFPADLGTYTLTLTVNSANFPLTVAQQTYSSILIVNCLVSSLTITTQAADATITLNQGELVTAAFVITQTAACNYPFTYSQTYTKAGIIISQPSWITFNAANNQKFSIIITSPSDVGSYVVTSTAQISQEDPLTPGVNRKISYSFTLIVQSDCVLTTITDKTINNMNNKVSLAAFTQDVSFLDQIATFHADLTYCGARTYSLSPTHTFLTILGSTMNLSTTSVADVGVYNVVLTVSLTSYSGVVSITKNFVVTITCEVQTLTFSTAPPASTTLQVGIDPQPMDIAFVTSQFPACGHTVTFSLNSPPSFLSLQGATSSEGNIRISAATILDHNTYARVLTATVDAKTTTANFSVIIKDPCSTAIIKITPATLSNMSMILYYLTTEQISQPVQIQTDVQLAHPTIVCPVIAQVNPTYLYIAIAADQSSIMVQGSLTTQLDIGIKAMTLTINSSNFPLNVTPKVCAFQLDLQACVVNNFSFTQTILNFDFILNQPAFTTSTFYANQQNLICQFTVTYTSTYAKAGSAITQPSWIAFSPVNRQISVSATSRVDEGLYTISVTAEIAQVLQAGGLKQVSFSFVLNVLSDCILTLFEQKTVINMLINVTEDQYQDLTITDTISTRHSNPTYCGQRVYTLSPSHQFLTMNSVANPNQVQLSSIYPLDEGIYPVTLTITLLEFPYLQYPSIKVDYPFTASIQCKILRYDLKSLSPLISDDYFIRKSAPLIFEFEFTEFPKCGFVYSLDPVKSFSNIIYTSPKNQVVISSVDLSDDGKYAMKLIAGPTLAHASYGSDQTGDVTFNINLIDVCKKTVLKKKIIPNIQLKNGPMTSTKIISNFYEFEHTYSPFDCGAVEKKLILLGKEPIPDWITLDSGNNLILINYIGDPQVFTKKFQLIATLKDYPNNNTTSPFNVTMNDYNIYCQNNRAITFEIGQEEPVFVATMYTTKTIDDGVKMTPFLAPIVQDFAGSTINMPPFIKYQQATHVLQVFDVGFQDIGTYFLGLRLGFEELPLDQVNCVTKLEVLYKAKFTGQEIIDQTLICGQPWTLKIPTYTDLFNQKAKVQVDLNKINSFLSYNDTGNLTAFEPDSLADFVGNYKIQLTLTDSVGQSAFVQFFLLVTCFEGKNKTTAVVIVPNFKLPPPKPVIQFINQFARVRVGFSRPILLPSFTRYPEFTTINYMRQNCTNGNCKEYRRLTQTNLTDEAQAIEIVNRGMVRLNKQIFGVVELKMIPGLLTDPLLLNFTWKCVEFKTTYMEFLLNYTHHEDVSVQEYRDRLEVIYYGRQYFVTLDGQIFDTQVSTLGKTVPPQMNPKIEVTQLLMGKSVQSTSKAILIFHFILSLFLGGALQQLFSAIKKMQIMIHLLIVNVEIPTNAQIFFSYLLNFATFNIIELDEPIRKAGKLYDDVLINENFYNLGYHSSYFLINMGNLYIVMLGLTMLLLLCAATQKIKNQTFKKWRGYVVQKLCWNKVFSFIDESFVIIAISCLANFSHLTYNSTGKFLSSLSATTFGFVLLAYPLFLLFFLRLNKDRLNKQIFKNKFDQIYENLKRKATNTQLLEPFFSVVRILVMCITLLYLQSHPYFQLFIATFSTLFIVIYVGLAEPFQDKKYHFFQQYNEVSIMLLIYHLWCLTDYLSDAKLRLSVGDMLVAFTCLNLFINFAFIMFNTCSRLYFKIRLWYFKRKLTILHEQIALRAKKKLDEATKISPRLQYIIDLEKQLNQPSQLLKPENKTSETQLVVQKKQNVIKRLSVIEEEKGESLDSFSRSQIESKSKSESLSKSESRSDSSERESSSHSEPSISDQSQSVSNSDSQSQSVSYSDSQSQSVSYSDSQSQSASISVISNSALIENEKQVCRDSLGINQSKHNLIKPSQFIPLKQPTKSILKKTQAIVKPEKQKKGKMGETLVEAKFKRRVIDLDEMIDIQEKQWIERRRIEEKEIEGDLNYFGYPPDIINGREKTMDHPSTHSPFAIIQSRNPVQDAKQHQIQQDIFSFHDHLPMNDQPDPIPAVIRKKKVVFQNLHQSMQVSQNQKGVNKRIKSPDQTRQMFNSLWHRQ